METEETWKDIEGFPGYQVSNLGNVKSLNYRGTGIAKVLKGGIKMGYKFIHLSKNGRGYYKYIHKLVWDAFSDIPRNGRKLQVDHINSNKLDNRFENLQLLTNRENTTKHQLTKKSSSKYIGVYWHKRDKKWKAQIVLNGKRKSLGSFTNELEAASVYQKELEKFLSFSE